MTQYEKKELREKIEEFFSPQRYKVELQRVRKNNNVFLDAITVLKEGSNVGVNFYINDDMDLQNEFLSLSKKIAEVMKQEIPNFEPEIKKENLFWVLRNDMNKDGVSIPFTDGLILQMRCLVRNAGNDATEIASFCVDSGKLAALGLQENEELFDMVMENTKRLFPAQERVFSPSPDEDSMLVITNEQAINGASVLAYREFMDSLYAKYGEFYILPSSVHEVIILPKEQVESEEGSEEELLFMIRSINKECLLPQEVLSDELFYFDGTTVINVVQEKIKKIINENVAI